MADQVLSSSQFMFSIMFKAFMFVLNSAVPFVLNWYFKYVPMFFLPPGDWFGPRGYLFSFPNAPVGAVSSTVWYVYNMTDYVGQLFVVVFWRLWATMLESFVSARRSKRSLSPPRHTSLRRNRCRCRLFQRRSWTRRPPLRMLRAL